MTCELIQVDFKKSVVTSRKPIDGKEAVAWVAVKDENFKDFVAGIAALAEQAVKDGCDWSKMIVVIQDVAAAGEDHCMVMYDTNSITDDEAAMALAISAEKIATAVIEAENE